jgi:hypothetical protein
LAVAVAITKGLGVDPTLQCVVSLMALGHAAPTHTPLQMFRVEITGKALIPGLWR